MKNPDEKLKEINQKIHRLQGEKRKLQRKKENAARKQRDHAMILVGATLLTHYSDETKEKVISSSDEEIMEWVHSLFKKR